MSPRPDGGMLGVAVMRLCERLVPGENADALASDTLEATLAGSACRDSIHTFHPGRCPEDTLTSRELEQ